MTEKDSFSYVLTDLILILLLLRKNIEFVMELHQFYMTHISEIRFPFFVHWFYNYENLAYILDNSTYVCNLFSLWTSLWIWALSKLPTHYICIFIYIYLYLFKKGINAISPWEG